MRKKAFLRQLTSDAEQAFKQPAYINLDELIESVIQSECGFAFLLVKNSEKGGVVYNRLDDVEKSFKKMSFELQRRGLASLVSTYMLDLDGEKLSSVVKGYDDNSSEFGKVRLIIIDSNMNFINSADLEDCPACLIHYERGNEKMFQLLPPSVNMMLGLLNACDIKVPSLSEMQKKPKRKVLA